MAQEEAPLAPGDLVKVSFALEVENGWPPSDTERLWAEWVGGDHYRIDNTPWFVRGLAADDVVEARLDAEGVRWAVGKKLWSGRLTIRVVPVGSEPPTERVQAVLDAFTPLGVLGEGAAPRYPIVALDIPEDIDWVPVKRLLEAGEAEGRWEYEEGCICDDWSAL